MLLVCILVSLYILPSSYILVACISVITRSKILFTPSYPRTCYEYMCVLVIYLVIYTFCSVLTTWLPYSTCTLNSTVHCKPETRRRWSQNHEIMRRSRLGRWSAHVRCVRGWSLLVITP